MRTEYNNYASQALEKAAQDAASCHQKYIGTEHLILGLLAQPDSLSGRVLYENGLNYENFLEAVLGESAALGDNANQTFLGYSPKAEHVLLTSEEEAIRMHAQQIGTEHILLAIIKEKDCIALRLMKGMNINLKKIYVDVLDRGRFNESTERIPVTYCTKEGEKKEFYGRSILCGSDREGKRREVRSDCWKKPGN